MISIIIPIRNERENIDNLTNSLKSQSIDQNSIEVIFTDDHSSDDSAEKILNQIIDYKNYKLICLVDEHGKKQAIRKAIEVATGELIVTVDADCSFGKNWLSSIAAFYSENNACMISGPVCMNQSGLFSSFQSLDFLSLVSVGAGAIGNKTPIMCNGANLIFKKSAYIEAVKDFNDLYISGDDVFLLNQINKQYPESVYFLKSFDAIVYTNPERTLKSFVNQRLRWVSKTSGVKNTLNLFTAVIVLFANLIIFLSLIVLITRPDLYSFLLFAIITKSIFDIVFLIFPSAFFKNMKLITMIIPMQVFYSFYISIVGIFGNFISFSWKERRSGRKLRN
ncbi:MAG: glycosyltransferase [Bacteroidota bacterium]